MQANLPYDEEELIIQNREGDLMTVWNEEQQDEPFVSSSEWLDGVKAEAAMMKIRILELESMRRQPHSWELVKELATVRARWKLTLWRIFPVNDLPVEILVNIINMAIMSHSSREVNKSRLAVASVCMRWREIVINTPSLWHIVEFRGMPPYDLGCLGLQRSRSFPLAILIDSRDREWDKTEDGTRYKKEYMTDLMTNITPILSRVEELYILCDTWKVILAALDCLRNVYAPILTRFEVVRSGRMYCNSGGEQYPKDLEPPKRLFTGGAPRLKHVCFDGAHVEWSTTPLKDLRVLEMRKMALEIMPNLQVFRKIIMDSSRLRSVVFEGSGPQWLEFQLRNWTTVELPCLENLTLGDFAVDYATFIMHLFAAPNLRRLTLCTMDGEDCNNLLAKLTGMFTQVTVLALVSIDIEDTDIVEEWLRSMPKIRYLKMARVGRSIFNVLLRFIQPWKVDAGTSAQGVDEEEDPEIMEPMCPVLETAECGARVEFEDMQKLLEGRVEMDAPLERLLMPINTLNTFGEEQSNYLRESGILSVIPVGSRPELDTKYLKD